jgi:hypothetical protein
MLDQIIHFVGLCLFAGAWALVGGWVIWASFRAVLRVVPSRRVSVPAALPARVHVRSGSLASLAA